ncbi:unnamed protein product [Arabidopsis lyrata]|nr:unnamed protein product [Arabidopsis lyrata]
MGNNEDVNELYSLLKSKLGVCVDDGALSEFSKGKRKTLAIYFGDSPRKWRERRTKHHESQVEEEAYEETKEEAPKDETAIQVVHSIVDVSYF